MARDPLIVLRIPPHLDARLRHQADTTGRTLSDIVRTALLDAYPTPTPAAPRRAKPRERPAENHKSGICEHRVRPGSYCRRCKRVV